MTDIAAIARGLTGAQRRAIRSFDAERFQTAKQAGVAGSSAYSLWNRPPGPNLEAPAMMLSRDYVDWPKLAWAYRLTPLGLAVRNYLEGQGDGLALRTHLQEQSNG